MKKRTKKQIKKAIRKAPLWLIIVILVIVIALGVILYLNKQNTKPNPPSNEVKDGIVYLGQEGTQAEYLKTTFLDLYGSSNNQQIGDSVFIEYGNIDILIDAGEKASGSCTVVPFIEQHVEDKVLEMVITTHADSDHLGGMVGLSSGYGALEVPGITYQYIIDFGYTADTQVYKDYVEIRDQRVSEGAIYWSINEIFNKDNKNTTSKFYLGTDAYLDFLDYKTYALDNIDDDNDRSVSCLVTHGEKKILLTGDAEKEEEKYLTELNIGKVDIFKANHHGSPTSNSVALLDIIDPEYVIICSSEENKYNLPKKIIIDRIKAYTSNIYATFLSGNIEVITKNNTITINSVKNLIPVYNSEWYLKNDSENPRVDEIN